MAEDMAPPKNVWFTTEQVKTGYGFDPTPYIERSNKYHIPNQLQPVRCGGCTVGFVRLWLKDGIERIFEDLKQTPPTEKEETIKQRCEREAREGLARK